MARILERLRYFQAQAFPSWQSDGAFGRGSQSEAALEAMDWLLERQTKVEAALARKHLSHGCTVLYQAV